MRSALVVEIIEKYFFLAVFCDELLRRSDKRFHRSMDSIYSQIKVGVDSYNVFADPDMLISSDFVKTITHLKRAQDGRDHEPEDINTGI